MPLLTRLLIRWVMVLLALGVCPACGPTITISSTRAPYKIHSVEPLTFIVFQGNTGPAYTEPLKSSLNSELRRTKIKGVAWVISGAEYNEEAILEEAASRSNCVILIIPAGGTSVYGQLSQILYDVRAFEIFEHKKVKPIWRGRVNAQGGTIDQRSEEFASALIERLITDNVLPRRVTSSE